MKRARVAVAVAVAVEGGIASNRYVKVTGIELEVL